MAEVLLGRQVFDKNKFNQTVDTEFTQLVSVPDETFFDPSLATVEDFFTIYNNLFFDIPKEGETNSHTFLIKESSEYVGQEQIEENIQALLDEIATLREENLELRQDLINTATPQDTVPPRFNATVTSDSNLVVNTSNLPNVTSNINRFL